MQSLLIRLLRDMFADRAQRALDEKMKADTSWSRYANLKAVSTDTTNSTATCHYPNDVHRKKCAATVRLLTTRLHYEMQDKLSLALGHSSSEETSTVLRFVPYANKLPTISLGITTQLQTVQDPICIGHLHA